jgi:hypothetical protein
MTPVSSIFSQLLQLIPRGQFNQAVKQHKAERAAKGFTCWGQFVAMLFCQVAHMNSLREVCLGLACCEASLKQLGLGATPNKSTLAYANAHRPWELHQAVFVQLLSKCQAEVAARGGRRKFRLPALYSSCASNVCGAPAQALRRNAGGEHARSGGVAQHRETDSAIRSVTNSANMVARSWTAEVMQKFRRGGSTAQPR